MSSLGVTFNLTCGKDVTELPNLASLRLSSFAESHQMQQKNFDISPIVYFSDLGSFFLVLSHLLIAFKPISTIRLLVQCNYFSSFIFHPPESTKLLCTEFMFVYIPCNRDLHLALHI